MEFFIATLASLFSVVNPIGAVPIYIALTANHKPAERQKIALKTTLYFLLILISFFLAGRYILSFFNLNVESMRIAGGLVILSSGFGLMSGKFARRRGYDKDVQRESEEKEDISFSPMAMPMLSGPGSISLLVSQFAIHTDWSSRLQIVAAIFAVGLLTFLILRGAPGIYRIFGTGGLNAVTRIMGFLSMAVGVQYILTGVVDLVELIRLK
jgi:multiple antibiotic resistance protein